MPRTTSYKNVDWLLRAPLTFDEDVESDPFALAFLHHQEMRMECVRKLMSEQPNLSMRDIQKLADKEFPVR